LNSPSTSSGFLAYQEHRIHYHRFGRGSHLLLALHGFGDSGSIFRALEPALASYFTTYAIDLPFHGKTEWRSVSYSEQDIANIFRLIARKEQQDCFFLMGYSFGGRLVLRSLPGFLPQLERIFLLAPDGLHTQWMAQVLHTPRWLRLSAKQWLREPQWLLRLAENLHRRGWLGHFPYHFVMTHLKTPERRDRLFGTWLSLNNFTVYPKRIRHLLGESQLPTDLYFGKFDPIITPKAGKKLADLPNVNVHLVEAGHQLIGKSLCQQLQRQLSTSTSA